MHSWFRHFPEFLKRTLMRAGLVVGIGAGILLVVISAFWESMPGYLPALVVLGAVFEGTYAAYRHEREERAIRETAFIVRANADEQPREDRVGGWLTAIHAKAQITVRPREQRVRITGCWLRVHHWRRSWRSLWFERREQIGSLYGLEPTPTDPTLNRLARAMLPGASPFERESEPVGERVLPLTLEPSDDSATFTVTFENLTNIFGRDGVRVSHDLGYEVEVHAEVPDTVVRAPLWHNYKRLGRR